jgi:RNA polymerase sigma factor (sigma-70 family)
MPRYASSSSAAGVLDRTATSQFDWELLYDVHSHRLRRIIQRRVGPALVEDVLQETFLRAYRNRHSIDSDRPIAPWLITIALRAGADAQRRQLRTVDSETVEQPCEESGFGVVEEELVRRAKALGIKHAFASLNVRQRRVLEAVAMEGMGYEQVARSEAMTPDAVKSVVARAKTNFRVSYSGFGRGSELFGGVVGAALLRLRVRLQRYQQFVGDHGVAFGAATLTVMAVGVATIPMARPIATEAAEMATPFNFVAASSGEATPASVTVPDVSSGAPILASTGSLGNGTHHSSSATEPGPVVELNTRTDVGKDDGMGLIGFGTEVEGVAENRGYAGVNVDCTRTTSGALLCETLDRTPAPAD